MLPQKKVDRWLLKEHEKVNENIIAMKTLVEGRMKDSPSLRRLLKIYQKVSTVCFNQKVSAQKIHALILVDSKMRL